MTDRSLGFSSYAERSEIVSEEVVPLMVSSRKMAPAPSSNSCQMRWVLSRSSRDKSIEHLLRLCPVKGLLGERLQYPKPLVSCRLSYNLLRLTYLSTMTHRPMKSSLERVSLSQTEISSSWDWSSYRWRSNCSSQLGDRLLYTILLLYFSLPSL